MSMEHTNNTPHSTFELLRSEPIASLNVTVSEYRHKTSGAQHIHIAADNQENVFLVGLRTIPTDSTGVAHILEHTVLCGSEHYPVRDPFFMMIRRSLNTFMNAFTSSDWTAYPFASQNIKDYYNLLDVYLDAVFFSRLDELDFAQEGHRVEFATPTDPTSELVFKGVVFNEMKGAMSSPISTLWQTLSSHLFPTTTYHYNSGGEPEHIPDLSYEALLQFYRRHYHPSNAVFMTYGNLPPAELQQRFEEKALSQFDRALEPIDVPDEQRFDQPQIVEDRYASDSNEDTQDKTHIVLGWLLGRSINLEAQFKAHLLSGVLLDNGASPLRHALETTALGSAPSPLCGIEDSNREMSFMCGIEGSNPEHANALEQLVLSVLEQVAQDGIAQDRVEAVLHQLELSQREISGDGYPYGLHLILGGLPSAIHRGDVIAAMNADPVLEKLRQDIADPAYIKNLVRELLLNNPHRVRLTMKPDATLAQQQSAAEGQRLAAIKAALTADQRQQIIDHTQDLARRQQQHDDPDVLPKVGLDDIPPSLHIVTGEHEQIQGFATRYYNQGTNGLCYQQIIIDLPMLDDALLDTLPYYTRLLTELGCGGRDYLATQAWQDSISGGIHAYSSVRGAVDNEQRLRGFMVLSGKALARNHRPFSQLMQQTLQSVRFDETDRIREIIAQERARREQSVTGQGHSLAMTAACSQLSSTAALNQRLRGLSSIQYLKQLDDGLDSEPQALTVLAEKLQAIHDTLLNAPRQFLLIGEQEQRDAMLQDLQQQWPTAATPASDLSPFSYPPQRQATQQMWLTNTQVNFCARAYPTVPTDHADAAALEVLGGFLRNGYLHRAIRETGGAYGGGASHDANVAAFRFYSYRDPRLSETLTDFDHAIDWLQQEQHEERQLEEAILGVIGALDKPGSPAGEAKEAFHNELFGRTAEQRQRFRQRVLDVSLTDLQRVGAKYLQPQAASTAVITSSASHAAVGDLNLQVISL